MIQLVRFCGWWSAWLGTTALLLASASASAQSPPAAPPAPDPIAVEPTVSAAPPPPGVTPTQVTAEPTVGTPLATTTTLAVTPSQVTAVPTVSIPLATTPPPAETYPKTGKVGTQIMLGPDSWLRFGFQVQAWANYQQVNTTAGTYSFDTYLRRARFIAAGQLFKDVGVFMLLDSPNLGRATAVGTGDTATVSKQFSPVIVQDAFGEVKFAGDAFMLEGGLMEVPFSHNGLQATTSYLTLDLGASAAVFVGTQTSILRDTGLQIKGYEFDDKFEWRMFVGQGLRQPANGDNAISHNMPRVSAHVQYQFFDPDKGYFYSGMTFGKKKLVGLSAGFDYQKADAVAGVSSSRSLALSGGMFGALPLSGAANTNGGDEFDWMTELYYYDGGNTFPSIVKQVDFNAELAYYNKLGFGAFGHFETKQVSDAVNKAQNNFQGGGGLRWFIHESFCNFTLAFNRVHTPNPAADAAKGTNQAVLQFQTFYF